MGQEVSPLVTPLVLETAAYAVMSAAESLGVQLSRAGALLLLALVWVETGRGSAVVRHNVGNLMAKGYRADGVTEYSVWSGDYWRPEWFADASHRLHQRMLDGQAPSAFRAYERLVDGMRDFVQLVNSKPMLISSANSGSVSGFVDALKASYSPDYKDEHRKTFNSLASEFRSAGLFDELPEPPRKSGGGLLWGLLIAAATGGLWLLGKRGNR